METSQPRGSLGRHVTFYRLGFHCCSWHLNVQKERKEENGKLAIGALSLSLLKTEIALTENKETKV